MRGWSGVGSGAGRDIEGLCRPDAAVIQERTAIPDRTGGVAPHPPAPEGAGPNPLPVNGEREIPNPPPLASMRVEE